MKRTLNNLLIIVILVCVAFAVTVVRADPPEDNAGLDGKGLQQQEDDDEKTYSFGLNKTNFILFIVGLSVGLFVVATVGICCCLGRCRRRRNRRRYIQPEYAAMKPGEKKFESRQSVLMVPARDVLFPTQIHNKSWNAAKDGDAPKYSEKRSIGRHSTIRVPKNSVRKNWTPGTDREPSGELKAQSWLADQEQQRETRKNWLNSVEAQREGKKSWVAGLAQRSSSPDPSHGASDSRRGTDADAAAAVPAPPPPIQRDIAREHRRNSSVVASLKQRETNPDTESSDAREESRDGNRRSWNPEVARRESLKRSSRGSRRVTTYRPNETSSSVNSTASGTTEAGDGNRPRRQSIYSESGTMWETVLERV